LTLSTIRFRFIQNWSQAVQFTYYGPDESRL
jgi:hypothetical protein